MTVPLAKMDYIVLNEVETEYDRVRHLLTLGAIAVHRGGRGSLPPLKAKIWDHPPVEKIPSREYYPSVEKPPKVRVSLP